MSGPRYYLVPIKVVNGNIISDFALAVKYENSGGSQFDYAKLKFCELTKEPNKILDDTDANNYFYDGSYKFKCEEIKIANKYSTVGDLLNEIIKNTENSLNTVEMDKFNYDYMVSTNNTSANENQYFLLPIINKSSNATKDVSELTKEHIKNIFKDPTNTDYDYASNEIPGHDGNLVTLDENVYVYRDGIVYPF